MLLPAVQCNSSLALGAECESTFTRVGLVRACPVKLACLLPRQLFCGAGTGAVQAVMLGTTHFVNACIQREGLARVGVIR